MQPSSAMEAIQHMTRQNNIAPVTFDVASASQMLGVSEYLIRKLVREGRLPHIRLGVRILFRQQAIDQFLHEQELSSVQQYESTPSGIRKVTE